jgi:hypothetical protein
MLFPLLHLEDVIGMILCGRLIFLFVVGPL